MSNNHHTARNLTLLALTTLLAATGAAVALPLSIGHSIATPAGDVSATAQDDRADACIDVRVPDLPALPALPAVPSLPVPVPVAVPAVPAIRGSAEGCIGAGLDGVSIGAGADAMGLKAGTEADLDTSQEHEAVQQTAGGLKGFFTGLADRITSWF
jgi:hypothetical protein